MQKFTLKVVWRENNIAIAIDHIIGQGYSPLTSYFFWPQSDAWDQIKAELDSKPWISDSDKIELLNKTTQIINYWQNNNKTISINEAKNQFADLVFLP